MMRKSLKRIWPVLLAVLLLMPAAACGGSGKPAENRMPKESVGFDNASFERGDIDVKGEGELPQQEEPLKLDGRKLIRTADLEAETYDFDAFAEKIRQEVARFQGYIERSSVEGKKADRSRYGSYIIRIPDKDLEAFLDFVKGDSNVVNQTLEVDDITLQYTDTVNRIESLRVEQQVLLDMLEKAKSLDDVLTIQARLTEVRAELENYESKKLLMDNHIDYAVLNLSVHEVQQFTTAPEFSYTDEVARRFREGWQNFARFFRGLSLAIVSNLFFLLLLVLIIVLIVVIAKVNTKRSRQRLAKRRREMAEQGMLPPGVFYPQSPPGQPGRDWPSAAGPGTAAAPPVPPVRPPEPVETTASEQKGRPASERAASAHAQGGPAVRAPEQDPNPTLTPQVRKTDLSIEQKPKS